MLHRIWIILAVGAGCALAGLALYIAWTIFDFFWSFSFSFG